jgi:hypothetical protein
MNQTSTIFFAGAEVETLTRALLDNGIKNILYSYYYILTMRRESFIAGIQRDNPDVNFFLDSGAYTYFTKWKTDASKLPPYKQYVERYFQYIDEYGENFCRITEPDLDHTIRGIEADDIHNWREEMLSNWPHLNVTPVWHRWRGHSDWTKYCLDPRIKTIAIGRDPGPAGLQRKLVLEARSVGKPVHGFGMTRINTTLKIVPYPSVDSTSWLTGQQYGTLYIFRSNKFITLATAGGGKEKRKLYKSYFKSIGCDPSKVIADDVSEVRKANVIAWRMLADRMEEIKKRKGSLNGQERKERTDFTMLQGNDEPLGLGIPRGKVRDGLDVSVLRPVVAGPISRLFGGGDGGRPLERVPNPSAVRPLEREGSVPGLPREREPARERE